MTFICSTLCTVSTYFRRTVLTSSTIFSNYTNIYYHATSCIRVTLICSRQTKQTTVNFHFDFLNKLDLTVYMLNHFQPIYLYFNMLMLTRCSLTKQNKRSISISSYLCERLCILSPRTHRGRTPSLSVLLS